MRWWNHKIICEFTKNIFHGVLVESKWDNPNKEFSTDPDTLSIDKLWQMHSTGAWAYIWNTTPSVCTPAKVGHTLHVWTDWRASGHIQCLHSLGELMIDSKASRSKGSYSSQCLTVRRILEFRIMRTADFFFSVKKITLVFNLSCILVALQCCVHFCCVAKWIS